MKTRTFTVLMTEEYDPANGVEMTDAEAIQEKRDQLQAACDDGELTGYFLIVAVDEDERRFWDEWKRRIEAETA